MPNGELIPHQTNMIIENDTDQERTATVTITFIADISQMGELVRVECNHSEVIQDLEDKVCKLQDSATFWEKLYENESRKKWYQKLFDF